MMDDGKNTVGQREKPSVPSTIIHQPSTSRDPLHGVTLERIVTHLHDEFGWEELAHRVPVKCFESNPSVSSSLKFLRKTPWAREQVEREYLKLLHREDANPLIDALKRGQALNFTGVSQSKLHAALGWMLRHVPQNAANLKLYLLPTLEQVQDVNFWPDSETMPLINLTIEHLNLGAADDEMSLLAELVKRGADLNDKRFWLPLMHTVDMEGQAYKHRSRAPRMDVLDFLLAHGAKPELTDAQGRTALQIAEAYGLKAAIQRLRPEPVEKARRRVEP